jgi:CubicO group peptidase (beta-lactamase class C family)
MTRICRLLQRVSLCAAALIAIPATPARAEIGAAQLEPAVAAYLDPLIRTNNFSGVILAAKGDRILFAKGYGYADAEQRVPNDTETMFQIASVSKPFTSAAIMRLAERGKLDLRAPISRLLPDYPNGDKLTVHHLLTHGSGIPNINFFPEYADLQLRPQTPASLVDTFKARPLEFEPGSRYSYSNSNYNLLALIIEKASGQPYGAFLKHEIFGPLGLPRIGHRAPMTRIVEGLADGYAPEGALGLQRADYLDWSAKTGNGSLYADARSLLRFIRAVNRGQLLQPASVAATFTPHFANIGYGWFLTEANGRRLHHSNGRSPGWAAQVDHYVEEDVTIVVLANLYAPVATPIARAMGALYFGEAVKPLPSLSPQAMSPERLTPLLGTYQFGPDYFLPNAKVRITSARGELMGEYVGHDYPAFYFVPTVDGQFLNRSFWMASTFRHDATGRAVELRLEDFFGKRIPED